MSARVIINEQHSLNSNQAQILEKRFSGYTLVPIPATGLSRLEQEKLAQTLMATSEPVIFVSPVPLLLAIMAGHCCQGVAAPISATNTQGPQVFLFHNDQRHKTEKIDGSIIGFPANTGWELLLL